MVKTKLKDIKAQINRQDADVYGDTTISGSMPDPSSDDDVNEVLGDAFGEDIAEEAEEHNPETVAEEINEDEKARHAKPTDQKEDEEE